MQPTVSIIVPVYNAESTLRRCVDSILRQEYTDFELILSNDGSQDGSGAICDEYAAEDPRVHVLHQENRGVSAARNHALDHARGTYLQFLDSDDWITPDATKLLVRTAQERQCDLVVSDFYRVVGDRVSQKGDIDDDRVLSREEYAAYMMENPADFYYGVLWNKLYRRDIVEQYRLRMDESVQWCEDFLFNLEYILHGERFTTLRVPIYYYVKTKGSLANTNLTITNTIKTKLMLFEYYHAFYKQVLDPEEFEKRRPKVYRFLFDAAQDGVVPPPMMPGSKRLGDERVHISPDSISAYGVLQEGFLERKLLEHYLEPVALQYGLNLREAGLLLCMLQENSITGWEELADFANMGRRNLTVSLKRLSSLGLIQWKMDRGGRAGERPMQITFTDAAGPILDALRNVQMEYEQTRMADFTEEERQAYGEYSRRICQNIQNTLR